MTHADQSEQIAELNNLLNLARREIREWEQYTERLTEQKESQPNEKRNTVLKQKQLQNLKSILTARNEEIQQYLRIIASRDSQLKSLQTETAKQLREKDIQLARNQTVNDDVAALNAKIVTQKEKIEETQHQLLSMTRERDFLLIENMHLKYAEEELPKQKARVQELEELTSQLNARVVELEKLTAAQFLVPDPVTNP